MHYKSDSATESCLIILLIKCEPEKNSFASPRARLGWQELKAARLFHRGEQECPSVQPDKGRLKSLEVTRTFAIDCWGRQNFTLGGDLLSKTLPLGHASSSKANHLSITFLLLSFTCFYMSNSKLGPVHFFIFPVFFFLKEGIWPQRTAAYWIMLLCVKASVFSTLKLLQI